MNQRVYETTTEAQLLGCRVRADVEMKTGAGSLPAGTIFRIDGKGGGLRLESDPCPHCGFTLYVTKVRPEHVTLLDPPKTRGSIAEMRAKRERRRGW
jgi:hypothetical protein